MSAPGPAGAAKDSRDDWATPQPLFDELDRVFHFTLDAAADETNHKCVRYLTPDEDAFSKALDLEGETIWCNPPYGRGLDRWVNLFGKWAAMGNTVVALLPASTGTQWFRLMWDTASEVWFLTGRVPFVHPSLGEKSDNTSDSMVVVWRPNPLYLGEDADGPFMEQTNFGPPKFYLWDWQDSPAVRVAMSISKKGRHIQ